MDLKTSQDTLAQRTHELKDTESKSRQFQTHLHVVQGNYTQAQEQVRKRQHELDALDKRLIDINHQLTVAQNNLANANRDIVITHADIQKSNKEVLTLHETELELRGNIRLLRSEQAALKTAIGEFAKANFTPLIFEQGQEILTGFFTANDSDIDLHNLLVRFYAAADGIIRRRSPNMPRTVDAMLFYQTPRNENDPWIPLTADKAVNLLMKRIRELRGPEGAVVRLAPENNVPIGGPAMIVVDKLTVAPNRIVYQKDEEVAQIRISEHAAQAAILGQLADDLLRKNVPDALRKKPMPMIVQRFDPRADGMVLTTPTKISWADLLAASEEVRKLHGAAIVTARARTVLHDFDPLDLTLDVTPVKP